MNTVFLVAILCRVIVDVLGQFYISALNNGRGNSDWVWLYITTTSPSDVTYTTERFNGVSGDGTVRSTVARKDDFNPDFIVTSDSSYTYREQGIYISYDSVPISVLILNEQTYTNGVYLAYPILVYQNIKKYQYFAVSTDTLVGDVSSEVLLVGISANTIITIIPSQSITVPQDIQDSDSLDMTVTAGTPYTVTLHRLQTFLFKSPLDLSGTSITSDKQLTVVSGHECGNVAGVCCCEHLTMQIPPTVTWGKKFLLTPFANRPAQYYKIISAESKTTIKYKCGDGSTFTTVSLRNAGDVSLQSSGRGVYCSLVSDKPVLVAQLGPGYSFGNSGDPVISMISPIQHFSSTSFSFISPEISAFTTHFINIATTTENAVIKMDGDSLSLSWNKIYDSNRMVIGYGAQWPITVKNIASHILSSNSKFSTLVYGFGSYTGYSYSAGVELKQLFSDSDQLIIQPSYGHILGGVPVLISGPSFGGQTDNIKVSFGGNEVDCGFISTEHALCISPLFVKVGQVSVILSHNGDAYDKTTSFYANPIADNNRVSISSDKLLFYAQEDITLTWSPVSLIAPLEDTITPSLLSIDIKLYIFQISNNVPRLEQISSLDSNQANDQPNDGSATITVPSISHSSNQAAYAAIISIEAKGSLFDRAEGRVSQWTDIIWISSDTEQSSAAQFQSACNAWAASESLDIGNELLRKVRDLFPCPRTIGQARTISSGYIEDSNMKLIKFLHPQAFKCFQQRTRTKEGFGNQCCYKNNGVLITRQTSGGSVVKVSVVGSSQFDYLTNLIRHQFEDVLPRIYCCIGKRASCDTYYKRRPSDDGSTYKIYTAHSIGDPHIITLDQHKYTFNGKGEFVLIEINDQSFTLQGRMVEVKNLMGVVADATVFSAFVAKDELSSTVQFEIRTVNNVTVVITLIDGEETNFKELKSQEFSNVTVTDSGNNTFSATFFSGAILQVQENNGFISVLTVSLPKNYLNKTQGLMGKFNGDKTDDLAPKGNRPSLSLNSTLQEIHEDFGVTWIIDNPRDSLFTYQFGESWSTFYFPFFTPAYEPLFSDPSLKQKADEICGDDEFCKFDIAATGRVEIGETTNQAVQEVEKLINLSRPISCNPPCVHGACVDTNVCACSEGYEGNSCNISVYMPCDSNPCNGGACQYHAGNYICKCLPGYFGDFCEKEVEFLCHLSPEVGPCKGAFPRWFYNITSGQCEIFSYGGCMGNENRFQSLNECYYNCRCPFGVKPKKCSSNICDSSVCTAYTDAVCFLDECSDCSPRYLLGNSDVTELCDSCSLVPDSGSCNHNSSRWYYNRAAGRCLEFTYGGCGGNQNNFKSLAKCLKQCGVRCEKNIEVVQCLYDPCITAQCLNVPNATCVLYTCGQCSARFYNTSGHDVTSSCISCPSNKPEMFCPEYLCNYQSCSNFPNAQCIIDNCGQCRATFIDNGTDVTDQCRCNVEGAIFKPCGSTCIDTCSSRKMNAQVVCSSHCKPGCACPAGQIVDDVRNKCVYPDQCYCLPCDQFLANCSNVIEAQNDTCGCPICGDCPIEGQEYQDNRTCPKMCNDPDIFCTGNGPGCGCPSGQLIDEDENQCVHPSNCSNSSLCYQPPVHGPCQGVFTRYFYNDNTEQCDTFIYGGCNGNENNFLSLHQCQQSCSNCPPTCTKEFCTIERNAICSLPNSDCEIDDCAITNCQACYYSYNELPMPSNCSQNCENPFDEVCMIEWGRCVRQRFLEVYNEIIPVDINFPGNFHCWNNKPCRLPN